MSQPQKLIVVDTNCYVRLLFWPQRPLMGRVVSDYKLVTTVELTNEAVFSSGLHTRHPWLAAPYVLAELRAATLKFSTVYQERIDKEATGFRQLGNSYLQGLCGVDKNKARVLSMVDAQAWATAVRLKGILATDEWPLRYAAKKIDIDDNENKLQVFSTLDVVRLLETDGQMQSCQRRDLMRAWRVAGENLHSEADPDYRRLFGEDPPHAQSAGFHNA